MFFSFLTQRVLDQFHVISCEVEKFSQFCIYIIGLLIYRASICVFISLHIRFVFVGDKEKKTANEFDQVSVILSCGEPSNFSITREHKVNFANSAFIEIRAHPLA